MSMIENPFMRGYQNLRIIRTLLITYEEDCPQFGGRCMPVRRIFPMMRSPCFLA